MRSPTLSLVTGLLLTAAATSTWAAQPLITDDTGTQGLGGNQLEFAYNRDEAEQDGISVTTRVLPFTYTRGLNETLDVFVGVDHTRITSNLPGVDASGSGNPTVGFKWRFYENESSKTSLGLKPELSLPISEANEAKGLGSGRASYALTAILTQETGFGAVHANLAAGRARFKDSIANPDATLIHASIAPVWDVTEYWKLALDLGSETERAGGNKTRSEYLEIGVIYAPNKDLDFALGFIRRTDHTSPNTTINAVTAGITWRFK
ncbi:MAG: transporter [Sterolibacterium sp.]|nr:transporter [Sterolibacterium sp.]